MSLRGSDIQKIYEDKDILVIDKPFGLIVNRSNTSKSAFTLQDYLDAIYRFEGNEEFTERSGIVHRLDKDTSGVLVVAKKEKAFFDLLGQFKNRKVDKKYICLVWGRVEDDKIEINAPIKRNPNIAIKFAVVAGGREAVTVVEKVKEISKADEIFTLLRVFPKTGRTHQIRVHLSAIGHPIVGDSTYCTSRQLSEGKKYFNRMMLHAFGITLAHPTTKKIVFFESKIPAEFGA